MQKRLVLIVAVTGCIALSGCSLSKQPTVTTGRDSYSLVNQQASEQANITAESESEDMSETGLYLITDVNTQSDIVTFLDLKSNQTVEYAYTGGTCYYDKFKELSTQDEIKTGSLVHIKIASLTNALVKIQVAENTWEKDNVTNYQIDKDSNVFTILGEKYGYTDQTMVFSDQGEITLDDISTSDTLRVFGMGKKILSVVITTGHGTVTVKNARDFVGGWIGLIGDKRYYYEITDNMQLEIPEGSYKLTASNKGYGGSLDITVSRNQNLDVDLSQMKGTAPKSAQITFDVIVANTSLYLDGNKIDTTKPVSVEYGTHSLQAFAEGYDTWTRKLVVNSDAATIPIDLTKTTDSDSTESDSSATTGSSSTNTTGTGTTTTPPTTTQQNGTATTGTGTSGSATTGTGTSGSTSSGTNSASDSYLNTLSGIVDTLTNSSGSGSSESQ